jgi:hypothetical protein
MKPTEDSLDWPCGASRSSTSNGSEPDPAERRYADFERDEKVAGAAVAVGDPETPRVSGTVDKSAGEMVSSGAQAAQSVASGFLLHVRICKQRRRSWAQAVRVAGSRGTRA